MALQKLISFSKTVSDLSDKPALTPTALKAQFDSSPNELKDALNSLIDALKLTSAGDSGAKNIGATTISGIAGSDVQTILESINTNFAKKPNPSYTPVALLNGFTTTGLSPGNPAYWKSDDKIVYIKGSCVIPASPQNKDIFVLPVGCRPSTTMTFFLNGDSLVSVFPSGSVQFASTNTGNLQFGCISFPAEQ